MVSLVLYQRVAPSDRVRVWLGVFGGGASGELVWTLDDAAVAPHPIRPLQPAHQHGARCATGIFEIEGVTAGRHRVRVREAGGAQAEIGVQAMPSEIPRDDWLRVLLISCYYRGEDGGHLAAVMDGLPAADRPHFSFMMGDQVYLDLPTIGNFPDDEARLAAKFEQAYSLNWTERRGLTSVLRAAPSAGCPDDHEYWNNFPNAATVVPNSWSAGGRQRWRAASDALFDAFQQPAPAVRGQAVEFDIHPVSFLVLDQRSHRREDRTLAATPEALDRLDAWVDRLIAEGKHGVVVTGQSLLDEPAGEFEGRFVDRTLADYGDYPRLVRSLVRLADAGRPVVLLTGDVHWGRVTTIAEAGRTLFYEVICSPSSLVSFVGADQIRTIGGAIAGFFTGNRNRWPRHGDPATPSALFARDVLGARKLSNQRDEPGQKGDQVAMLYLRQSAGTIEMKVVYYEVHERPMAPVVKGPWLLRQRP